MDVEKQRQDLASASIWPTSKVRQLVTDVRALGTGWIGACAGVQFKAEAANCDGSARSEGMVCWWVGWHWVWSGRIIVRELAYDATWSRGARGCMWVGTKKPRTRRIVSSNNKTWRAKVPHQEKD